MVVVLRKILETKYGPSGSTFNGGTGIKQDLSLDFQFNSSIKQVWDALTDFDKLEWVLDNNFKPVVGHRFQFRREPIEGWDGIIHCEVLEVDEPHRLSYTWFSRGENTTIIWTLKEDKDGTVHPLLEEEEE